MRFCRLHLGLQIWIKFSFLFHPFLIGDRRPMAEPTARRRRGTLLRRIGGSFYNAVNWHDDVADGPVLAEIIFADGSAERAVGAWIVVGPPDYARGSSCVVTLYDVIKQVAVNAGWIPAPSATSFTQDVFPLLHRARSLRWAHGRNMAGTVVSEPIWNQVSEDYSRLASPAAADKPIRADQKNLVLAVQTRLIQFQLTAVQLGHLNRWESGTFVSDWVGDPSIAANPTPASLTQAALDGTAGQGFFPGIEGGRILTDPSLYNPSFDFRIDHGQLAAGDVTALMAQPWQADFLKCSGNWWPSQRPDIAPQSGGTFKMWARLGASGTLPNHQQLVDHVMQFGVNTPRVVGGVEVNVEEGRDVAAVGP